MMFFNSQNEVYKKPYGAMKTSEKASFHFQSDNATDVFLCINIKGNEKVEKIKMMLEAGLYKAEFNLPDKPGLVLYWFEIHTSDVRTVYYGAREYGIGGEGIPYEANPIPYQLTVYDKDSDEIPDWYKHAVVYQIFPDRFDREDYAQTAYPDSWYSAPKYDKDDEGNVISWEFYGGTLEGIRRKLPYIKSLGANCIYLNPIFKAKSNHRYDTDDYFSLDPRFASDEDFDRFIKSADEMGIRIILDGVFNHTGINSRYREEHPDWYTGNFWWGVKDLPEIDEDNESFRDFICGENGVIRYWIRRGISGWRLDVADELPDSFIKDIRSAAKKENSEAIIIGEVWEDASNKYSHNENREYLFGHELDGVMNYPFRKAFIDFVMFKESAQEALSRLEALRENYPLNALKSSFNILGTHDRERILSLLGGKEYEWFAKRRLLMGLALSYAFPGVPCIYYGDEAGLYGNLDPENRAAYPWEREDEDLCTSYRLMSLIFKGLPWLNEAKLKPLDFGTEILSFVFEGEEKLLVLLNRNDNPIHIEYDCNEEYALELINSHESYLKEGKLLWDIPGVSAALILLCKKPPQTEFERGAGVLCHLSSLPEGRIGKDAYDFVDFLSNAGFKYWQMLPINPIGLGDSPYMSPNAFAMESSLGSFDDMAKLKEYANSKGIKLIGDLPIYVPVDGLDVKNNPDIFDLSAHAGCPPDYYAPKGQDWGTALYNWQEMKKTGYRWWIDRIKQALQYFDIVRIDHFRGFSAFFSIPNGGSPKDGYWMAGPGIDFFNELRKELAADGKALPVIAEDMGVIDSQVQNLLKLCGFPGMNLWQTDKDAMSWQTPDMQKRRIYYASTHDSNTLIGFFEDQGLQSEKTEKAKAVIEELYAKAAPIVMLSIQDILGLGTEARMNVPGTPSGNWHWKMQKNVLTKSLENEYLALAQRYGRV